MPIIIFGLGNNEAKYLDTKHNAGRLLVENIAQKLGVNFVDSQGCRVAKYLDSDSSSEIWFVYSLGYMNESGLPLSKLLKYFKVDVKAKDFLLLVAQDDSDQLIGCSKLSIGGGSAGHNGIISIYQHLLSLGLSTTDIWRLKIGIRPPENRLKSETFVLSTFNSVEKEFNQKLVEKILQNKSWLFQKNKSRLQNILNIKPEVEKSDPKI